MNKSNGSTLPIEYFNDIYQAQADPWQFETSPYEAAKYAATLAALPQARYESAFEVGCSIGVLTVQLAARCDALLAVDVSEKALEQAEKRCEQLPQVRFAKMQIPADFPPDSFDLILVSEVGYYLSREDWQRAVNLIVEHLNPRANVVLVHWTPFVHDYPQTGDAVHDQFKAWTAENLKHLREERTEKYRLDVFERI